VRSMDAVQGNAFGVVGPNQTDAGAVTDVEFEAVNEEQTPSMFIQSPSSEVAL